MSRHEKHLSSYLNSKRSDVLTSGASASRKALSLSLKKSSGKSLSSGSKVQHRNTGYSTNVNRLPDEVLLKVFRHLRPSDLLVCAQVCQRWSVLSKESSLWQRLLPFLPMEVRDLFKFEEIREEDFNWKCEIVKRCINARNKKILGMCRKVSAYTGLPADSAGAMKFASVLWKLCVTDISGNEHWVAADDVTHFSSSSSVRWYSFQLPPLTSLTGIQVYAFVPVFFHRNWKPHVKSASTRSLIFKHDLGLPGVKLSRTNAVCESDMITVHTPSLFPLFACWTSSWKDGGEFAFISASFHHYNLIKKILKGSHDSTYVAPPHRPVLDDVDPKYGLHGYSATVELRNHKTVFWGRQYRELYEQHVTCDVVCLGEYGPEHGSFHKRLSLPWKTELFKNILLDMCFVDVTVLDDQKKPLWCASSSMKISANQAPNVDFSAEGERLFAEYKDDCGVIRFDFLWIADEELTLVSNVEFQLFKSFVNSWFGTSH